MKTTSKSKYQRIFDLYQNAVVGGRPVTLDEVAEWAIERGLCPPPGIRDAVELHETWERRFAKVTNDVEVPS